MEAEGENFIVDNGCRCCSLRLLGMVAVAAVGVVEGVGNDIFLVHA